MDFWTWFWLALAAIGVTGELVALRQRHGTLTSKVAQLPFVARLLVIIGLVATAMHFSGVF